jgi:hypothetical protein
MPGCFNVGEQLAEMALRRDSGQALASIVSHVGTGTSGACPPAVKLHARPRARTPLV